MEIIRSDRRTIAIEIKSDARIIVRAPFGMSEGDIRRFVAEKASWIEKHTASAIRRSECALPAFSQAELVSLADAARVDIPRRVAFFARNTGISFGRITIRAQHTRWGSCSSEGNLNFNCLLMLCPPEVRDYVAVHELCHRVQPNHSRRFWAEVGRVLPGYEAQKKWLRDNGNAIIGRIQNRS